MLTKQKDKEAVDACRSWCFHCPKTCVITDANDASHAEFKDNSDKSLWLKHEPHNMWVGVLGASHNESKRPPWLKNFNYTSVLLIHCGKSWILCNGLSHTHTRSHSTGHLHTSGASVYCSSISWLSICQQTLNIYIYFYIVWMYKLILINNTIFF